jgi:hypothetical protein
MITSTGLHDLNTVVIPHLGFPFSKFSFQIFKINNFKGIRIRLCLSNVFFPFHPKLIKMALYLYSTNLIVQSKYLCLTWCAFENQVRKFSLTLCCRGRNRAMPK